MTSGIIRFSWFFVALVLVTNTGTSGSSTTRDYRRDDRTGHVGTTREEILVDRIERIKRYESKIEALEQEWEDHVSGYQLLTKQRAEKVQQSIKTWKHKIDFLTRDDLWEDEHFLEGYMEREKERNAMHRRRMARSEL